MSAPTDTSLQAVKRLARYLKGRPRLVYKYCWQVADHIDVYSDTDWAGCLRTRKSTSGGCVMLGSHLIKAWSSTQASISLSSGEAEFYGVVKAAGVGLGYGSLLHDVGVILPLRVWTDSTATIGICGRQGLGKLRHVDTQCLWIQQRVRDGTLTLLKVRGEDNPADLFTKHLAASDRIPKLLEMFGCSFREGRPALAPALRAGKGNEMSELLQQENPGLDKGLKLPPLGSDDMPVQPGQGPKRKAKSKSRQPDQELQELRKGDGDHDSTRWADFEDDTIYETMTWTERRFPRALSPDGNDYLDVPEAYPILSQLLPHQHEHLDEHFPRAVACPAPEEVDLEEDMRLERLGWKLGVGAEGECSEDEHWSLKQEVEENEGKENWGQSGRSSSGFMGSVCGPDVRCPVMSSPSSVSVSREPCGSVLYPPVSSKLAGYRKLRGHDGA